MKKLTTDSFIEKAIKIQVDRYDYSKVEYVNNRTKVRIICKEHGVFEQTPNNHLNKQGCPKCNIGGKLNTNYFIEKFIKIHGNRYDYSLVKYINNQINVKIICKEHGVFEQRANSHSSGRNCPRCYGNKKMNTNDFIEKSNKVHGDRYDYSLVEYINNKSKVKIICKRHGIFEQRSDDHLSGIGCDKCSGKSKSDTNDFTEKANAKHNNKYDYSSVEYINCKTKVKIICKEHGMFTITPNDHLNRQGCAKCSSSKGENKIMNILIDKCVIFESQKTFEYCKNKHKLPFDFYLPEYNICIEFDGKQHFEPINFFGGKDAFNKTKINDNIKNKYCSDNNIKLIRIPYYNYENIEHILNDELLNVFT